MQTKSLIRICAAGSGVFIAVVLMLMMGFPGLLLGSVIGLVAAITINERLQRMTPENRRRVRRMMRNEGLR
jgi:ABC-type lipoprotein release transport system permease subunit